MNKRRAVRGGSTSVHGIHFPSCNTDNFLGETPAPPLQMLLCGARKAWLPPAPEVSNHLRYPGTHSGSTASQTAASVCVAYLHIDSL